MDRAYIDYEKLEEMTQRGVVYVTKMKKNLKYNILNDTMYQLPKGLMEVRIQHVTFTKQLKEKAIIHHARIITYVDENFPAVNKKTANYSNLTTDRNH